MRTEDTLTVWSVCVECYVSAAYGVDNVENDTRTDTERDTYRRTVAGYVGIHPGATPDELGDPDHVPGQYDEDIANACHVFGKYPCQACGSPLAGERHAIAGWKA
jgi:hypothetical protein